MCPSLSIPNHCLESSKKWKCVQLSLYQVVCKPIVELTHPVVMLALSHAVRFALKTVSLVKKDCVCTVRMKQQKSNVSNFFTLYLYYLRAKLLIFLASYFFSNCTSK